MEKFWSLFHNKFLHDQRYHFIAYTSLRLIGYKTYAKYVIGVFQTKKMKI